MWLSELVSKLVRVKRRPNMSTQTRESEKSEKSEDVKIIHLFILDKSWSMSAV